MNNSQQYLESRVKTASQSQLHLMLIEGGIRFASEANSRFEQNDVDGASQPLRFAMDIASELSASVKHSTSDLNTKLAALYQFVFTRLTMAFVNSDREKLAEAIRVLEIQRETWRLAIEKGTADESADPAAKGPHKPVTLPAADMTAGGGLSLEV